MLQFVIQAENEASKFFSGSFLRLSSAFPFRFFQVCVCVCVNERQLECVCVSKFGAENSCEGILFPGLSVAPDKWRHNEVEIYYTKIVEMKSRGWSSSKRKINLWSRNGAYIIYIIIGQQDCWQGLGIYKGFK